MTTTAPHDRKPGRFEIKTRMNARRDMIWWTSVSWSASGKKTSDFLNLYLQSQTKKLGHEASSPFPPLSMLIIRWLFSLFVRKNAIFSNIDKEGRGIRNAAQVSQLLLAGIVWKSYASNFPMKVTPATVMASRYFRTLLRLINDVRFVSANWTELLYANQG